MHAHDKALKLLSQVRVGAAWLWAGPNTAIGLIACVCMIATGGRMRVHGGTVECEGGRLGSWFARRMGCGGAITLGHVILATSHPTLEALRDHERAHVRQFAQWGPFFLPAYALSSAWQWLQGRHFYRDNFFERQANGTQPTACAKAGCIKAANIEGKADNQA